MIVPGRLQEIRLFLSVVAIVGALGCATKREPATSKPVPRSAVHTGPTHTYIVREGDSLGAIADCSGVSVDVLARMNGIRDPDQISAGARLRLPGGHPCIVAAPLKAPQRRVARAPRPDGERELDAMFAARAQADTWLARASAQNDAADFEAALTSAEMCIQKLAPICGDAKAKQIGSRCHVIAGMAAAGLERRERAIEEFRQAFALDPNLKLSPQTTSPRILELVSEAQPDVASH